MSSSPTGVPRAMPAMAPEETMNKKRRICAPHPYLSDFAIAPGCTSVLETPCGAQALAQSNPAHAADSGPPAPTWRLRPDHLSSFEPAGQPAPIAHPHSAKWEQPKQTECANLRMSPNQS